MTDAMNTSSSSLYVVGDCPVCPGFESVLVLVSQSDGSPVFWCPMCSLAWHSVPGDEVNELNEIWDVAAEGVRLPTLEDLRAMVLPLDEVPYSVWADEVDEVLAESKTKRTPGE